MQEKHVKNIEALLKAYCLDMRIGIYFYRLHSLIEDYACVSVRTNDENGNFLNHQTLMFCLKTKQIEDIDICKS